MEEYRAKDYSLQAITVGNTSIVNQFNYSLRLIFYCGRQLQLSLLAAICRATISLYTCPITGLILNYETINLIVMQKAHSNKPT